MATGERKRMLAEQINNSTKVRPKILSLNINLKILRSRYSEEEYRVVRAALGSVALTRKSGKVSDSVKVKTLEALSKFSPEIVAKACQLYVSKCCATDGKNERYLIGIARGLEKQKEATRGPKPVKVDPETHWEDRGRIYDRAAMEGMARQLDDSLNERRNVDPQTVSRVSRCRNDRPTWEWR